MQRIPRRRATAITVQVVFLILCAAVAHADEAVGPTTALAGKALALDGNPLAGVAVTFTAQDPGYASHTFPATSDARGEFRAQVPQAWVESVRISVEPLPDRHLAPCSIVWPQGPGRVPGPSYGPVTLFFAPGTAKFTGTVMAEGDKPIAGAAVSLVGGDWSHRFTRSAITQADGRFQIDNLAPGDYHVHSVAAPAGQAFIPLENYKPQGVIALHFAGGETVDRKFLLAPSARLAGRVFGFDGKPLAGASVSCSLDSATETGNRSMYQKPGEWYEAAATTDAQGRYVLSGLTAETYRIRIKPAGAEFAPTTVRDITVPAAGDLSIQDVTLSKAAKLVAIILGGENKPLAGASVRMDSGSSAESPAFISDAQGRVTLAGLTSGKFTLHVDPPAGLPLARKTFTGLTAVGGLCVEHSLSMTAGATVSGTVVDPQGKPVAGANVSIMCGYVPLGKLVSDQAGHFALGGITPLADAAARGNPPAAWQVSVIPPDDALDLMEATVTIPDPTVRNPAPVSIRLTKGAVITGLVTDPAGKPVANCNVTCGKISPGSAETYGSATTNAQGRYALGHVQPGNWSVAVLPPAATALRGQLSKPSRVTADGESTVNITLQAGQTISGKIVTAGGKPGSVCLLHVQANNDKILWFMREEDRFDAISSPDGSFRITGLPPGNLKLKCTPVIADGVVAPVEVTVEQGKPVVINMPAPSK